MIRVVQVSNPACPPTRLHLPTSAWGNMVHERLAHLGWTVRVLNQEPYPDTRDAAELARRDDILNQVDP